jgi:hypothetical protein
MDRRGPDPTAFYIELQRQGGLADHLALFRAAVSPFGFVALACGEIDLSDRDHNVMYFADWPPELRRNYIHRDPVINALCLYALGHQAESSLLVSTIRARTECRRGRLARPAPVSSHALPPRALPRVLHVGKAHIAENVPESQRLGPSPTMDTF